MSTRLGIISDAHGNAPAMTLCLRFLRRRRVDRLLFLGDALGYLPFGATVCRILDRAQAFCIMGNHEAILSGEIKLQPEQEAVIGFNRFFQKVPKSWQEKVKRIGPRKVLEMEGRRLILVHGSPDDPLEGYVRRPEDLINNEDADAIIMGHTHIPYIHRNGEGLLLNPGSCGLPRDRGDLLSLAVLELPEMKAEVIRITYPFGFSPKHEVHFKVTDCLARRGTNPFGTILSGLPWKN